MSPGKSEGKRYSPSHIVLITKKLLQLMWIWFLNKAAGPGGLPSESVCQSALPEHRPSSDAGIAAHVQTASFGDRDRVPPVAEGKWRRSAEKKKRLNSAEVYCMHAAHPLTRLLPATWQLPAVIVMSLVQSALCPLARCQMICEAKMGNEFRKLRGNHQPSSGSWEWTQDSLFLKQI